MPKKINVIVSLVVDCHKNSYDYWTVCSLEITAFRNFYNMLENGFLRLEDSCR